MLKNHPRQIKYIVGNEAAERYSFYGMRSILVVYMISYIFKDMGELANAHTSYVYHLFMASCYLITIGGAYLSDRFLGKYKTILYLSIIYTLGFFILAFIQNKFGLYVGLSCIALGSGGIKPAKSANVGDQYKSDQKKLMRKVFDLFYFAVNFGSFFAKLATPWTLSKFGPVIAFGSTGVLMSLSVFTLWLGRKQYVIVPPTGKNPHGTLAVLISAFKNIGNANGFFKGALLDHPKNAVNDVKAVFDLVKPLMAISIFFALFDQHSSTWVVQAKNMDLNFMGYNLLPAQIPALNPIMVMLLIPICSNFIYPLVERIGIKLTPLRKIGSGLFITAFSFGLIAAIQYQLDVGNKINIAWQFLPYLIITIAEVFISVPMHEFSYTQAPRSMKSTVASISMLSVFAGNMLAAFVIKMNNSTYSILKNRVPSLEINPDFFMFCFFTTLTVLVSIGFVFIAKRYKMRNYMESAKVDKIEKEDQKVTSPLINQEPLTE